MVRANARGGGVRFDSGLAPVFWQALLEALARCDEVEEEERIIALTAPWISDLPFVGTRWSRRALSDVLNGRPCSKLSDLLSILASKGYNVTVIIAAPNGKFLKKTSSQQVRREMEFLRRLAAHGVSAYRRPDFHGKNLITPFVAVSGSANWTGNGLTGRLIENLDVYRNGAGQEGREYRQAWLAYNDGFSLAALQQVSSDTILEADLMDVHAISLGCSEEERVARVREYILGVRQHLEETSLGLRIVELTEQPGFDAHGADVVQELLRMMSRDRELPV